MQAVQKLRPEFRTGTVLERVLTRIAKESRTHWRNIGIILGQDLCSLLGTNMEMQILPFLDQTN